MALLLGILKAAGIILLAAALLIIIILLLILFVPVRYSFKGSYENKTPDGAVNISWLFRIIRIELVYDSEVLVKYKLRLCGITLFDGNI